MCGGEERSLMLKLYVFPSQHSSQTAVFIQNSGGEGGGEGQCPRDDIILSASAPTTAGRRRVRGESCRGWWTGCIWCQDMQSVYACVHLLEILFPCSPLRSLPTHSQSFLIHFAEYCSPQINTLRGRLDWEAHVHSF